MAAKYELDRNRRVPTGLYGWRKRLLYLAVILLLCLILVNFGLTIWILSVLRFNIHGVGSLRFSGDDLIVEGTAEFLQGINTGVVSGNGMEPVVISSGSSVLIQVANSSINVSQDSIEIVSDKFDVGNELSVTNESVTFHSKVDVPAGAYIGNVSADRIESRPGEDLKISSFGNKLSIEAETVEISSAVGDVSLQAANAINLMSVSGDISLTSQTVILSNLPVVTPSLHVTSPVNTNIMEVCVCAGTKQVFLLPAHLNLSCAAGDYCA